MDSDVLCVVYQPPTLHTLPPVLSSGYTHPLQVSPATKRRPVLGFGQDAIVP